VANRTFLNVVNGAIGILVLYIIGFVLVQVFQCRPLNALWLQFSYPDHYTKKFTCISEGIGPVSNAIVSVATDFMTDLLPIFLFRQLHLPKREKVALYVLFSLGFM
jgi:hypothetical protein